MKHRGVQFGVIALLMLLFVWLTGCGTAQSSQQAGPVASITTGAQSPATSSETTTTTLLFSQTTPQQWYESGFYMGYWAGNVETIPAKPKDLPEVFFSGPTPSAPIRTDEQGNPMQKDPSKIKKPLWVFGDEVRVALYTSQIRQAEKDGRPIIFYATSIPDACRALGIEQHGSMSTPLAGSIVIWPSQMGGNGEVEFMGWNPVAGNQVFVASFIFRQMVGATLLLLTTPVGGESSTIYMTAGTVPTTSASADAPSMAADDPSLSHEDSAGRSPGDAVLAVIAAHNQGDWRLAYSLYAQPDIDFKTAAVEWAQADETYEGFLVRETRVVKENAALVRVTYQAETTPPGGQRYPVIVNEPGEWWRVEKADGLWKVGWLPRQ